MPESKRERRGRLFREAVENLQLENPNAEIAARTGYDKGNLSKILKGSIQPSNNFIQLFEEEFSVKIEDFDKKSKELDKDIRFEEVIAREILMDLSPYLNDFQKGHRIVNEHLNEISGFIHELSAQIIELRTELDEIRAHIKSIHRVTVEQE